MKPTRMQICVASWDYGSVLQDGTLVPSKVKAETQKAWDAANSGIIGSGFKYKGLADITEAFYCPVDHKDNLQVFNAHGINQNNVPAMIVGAEYPDGHKKVIILRGDYVGSTGWNQTEIEKALSTLWLDLDASTCDIKLVSWIPVVGVKISNLLCRLPAYLWLAALAYMSYKAYTAPKQRCRLVAGAGAAGSLYMFNRAGGLSSIKQ